MNFKSKKDLLFGVDLFDYPIRSMFSKILFVNFVDKLENFLCLSSTARLHIDKPMLDTGKVTIEKSG